MIDVMQLKRIADGAEEASSAMLASELQAALQEIRRLRTQLSATVKLPYVTTSPVCEIDAGYAAGVSDCKEAIRRAGFLVEGDD